jgi:hypothetical protein
MLVLEKWIQMEHGNEFDVNCDWREGTGASWTVDNTDGKKICKGLPGRIQTKMWRDVALKSVVTKDQDALHTIMGHCYQTAPTRYESNKPRSGEELVEDIFAVKGARLLEYRRREESTKALIAKIYKNHASRSGPGRQEDDDYENRNMNCYLIEDEWYVDDAEMQNARAILKKLLNFVYEYRVSCSKMTQHPASTTRTMYYCLGHVPCAPSNDPTS